MKGKRAEYIATIFKIMCTEEKVTNKLLSEQLDVAPSSITEMLKKLKSSGYLKDVKSIELTEEGVELAKDILSKHRLWEYFIEQNLGVNWKYVNQPAQDLQSVTSDDIFDRLNKFLDFPKYCPHGSIIYRNNNEINVNLIKLSEAKTNIEYIIRKITDFQEYLNYAEDKGITIGKKIVIKKIDEFDYVAIVEIEGEIKRISPKICEYIYLKEM